MADFKSNLNKLNIAIDNAMNKGVDISKKIDDDKAIYDYNEKKKLYYRQAVENGLKFVKAAAVELPQLSKYDTRNSQKVSEILELMPELETKDLKQLRKLTAKMRMLTEQLNFPKEDVQNVFPQPSFVPSEISSEVRADINELNKCFNSGCLRSTVILCGRLLETALHRKYFETTGNDILEKNPGIGLGNLIGKLKDKGVSLDPALTNQIHLINQVRIFSVHKKKEAFCPSKEQAHAIVLYTLDVLERVFKTK